MTTRRTSRPTRQGIALVAIFGLLSACGGSDDAAPTTESAGETTPSEPAEEASAIDAAAATETEAAPDSEPEAGAPAAPTARKTAMLSLDNGESFEFSVLCALEPQIAAGSEILFTATSYDDPGIDITQFGDEGPVTGVATISVYDASFETLWDAGSFYEAFGGTIELALDGSTITGSGAFFPAGDVAAAPVDGTLVANC